MLRDYFIEVSDGFVTDHMMSDEVNVRAAVIYFKEKIVEGRFLLQLQKNLNSAGELLLRLNKQKQEGIW